MRPKLKLQTAAESAGRTVSEFVLESAQCRTDETLADRTRFGLDADRWKAFMEALDAPAREIPRLGRLLKEPSIFERGRVVGKTKTISRCGAWSKVRLSMVPEPPRDKLGGGGDAWGSVKMRSRLYTGRRAVDHRYLSNRSGRSASW